jgi:hypothetical protein
MMSVFMGEPSSLFLGLDSSWCKYLLLYFVFGWLMAILTMSQLQHMSDLLTDIL